MGRKKSRMSEEDIVEMYDLATTQLKEDRAAIDDVYNELRDYVRDHVTRYIECGEVLAKLADLRMKQTAQVIDVFKIIEKSVPTEEFNSFSTEELQVIDERIKQDTKVGKKGGP